MLPCSTSRAADRHRRDLDGEATGHFLHRVPDVLVDLANDRGGTDNITVVVCCAVATA